MTEVNYAILGLARTGLSAIEFLQSKGIHRNNIYCWDDNHAVHATAHDRANILAVQQWPFHTLKFALVVPGFNPSHAYIQILKKNNVKIISDIDLFFKYYNSSAKVLAVTGSNGKTTVCTMLEHAFKVNNMKHTTCGNIGTPALSVLQKGAQDYYILELSSFQLYYTNELNLDASVIINITPDHLNYHGSFENYCHAKSNIISRNKNRLAVTWLPMAQSSAVDGIYNQLKDDYNIKLLGSSKGEADIYIKDNRFIMSRNSNDIILDYNTLSNINGLHNLYNIMSAYALWITCDLDGDLFINSLRSFQNKSHRQEVVKKINNVTFVNDSKATTPYSGLTAVEYYNNIYWLVGGKLENKNFQDFANYKDKITQVYTFGSGGKEIKDILDNLGIQSQCYDSIRNALEQIKQDIPLDCSGATVLFSPCCLSFDQFKHYEERGDYFKHLVKEMFNV